MLAVNVALVALAGTVTEAGSMRTLAMAPEIVTTTPPAGAAPAKVTVQVGGIGSQSGCRALD